MNRIILIGNGFDLAHGLPTKYEDFINWYWDRWLKNLKTCPYKTMYDNLCEFSIKSSSWQNLFWYEIESFNLTKGYDFVKSIISNTQNYKVKLSPLLKRICIAINDKKWVDIENEYYTLLTKYAITEPSSEKLNELNNHLQYIQKLLTEYLTSIDKNENKRIDSLWNKIYTPINPQDISIEGSTEFSNYINFCLSKRSDYWNDKQSRYGLRNKAIISVENYVQNHGKIYQSGYPDLYMLPDYVLLVNFNYTNMANPYLFNSVSSLIHIHGDLTKPESVIFGYGDEMDSNYSILQNLNDNVCLQNIKSIKYLESDNYRNILNFIEAAPYQIFIMGHSCGNSDRTLLNTLFEHKNCISIKPYYHQKDDGSDNYMEIVQNISRNFTDMKLMRDRVVNKIYCEPLPQINLLLLNN